MHQAAAHKLAMRFMAKADHQLSQVDSWNSLVERAERAQIMTLRDQ